MYNMKKYKVIGQIGSSSYDMIIECNYFSYGNSGAYYFRNSETGGEWYFPIMQTVVRKIINE